MIMTLFEYLSMKEEGEELTVWDKDYEIETYFYNDEPDDSWSSSICKLSKKLSICGINKNGVYVDLSFLIQKNIDKLKKMNLFIKCDIDSIMRDIENILSGHVSEEWMKEFVEALK